MIPVPISFYVANPNSFLWFNTSRPIDPSSCNGYDDWKEGLSKYYPTYGAALAADRKAVLARWNSRTVTWARALNDSGEAATGCADATTGASRGERFYNALLWWPPSSSMNVDYIPNVKHNDTAVFASTAGMTRLFFDNFYGNGIRHLDFGPRQQFGDSPHPDPLNPLPPHISGIGANGARYAGCWSDAGKSAALPHTAFNSKTNTTVYTCTSACAKVGYPTAGMENGTSCICGQAVGAGSGRCGDAVCTTKCSGNSAEFCGGARRLSVWAN